ncbi:putative uncharacterized protein DDB_G0285119 [Ambystoma mexicanum]|uniref:putative uncharacterized protein DDB_G0285119 n=1 Tax=Ambystoma mexicanum TaxID=8296 RepID=UPI0037E7BB7D
MSVITIALNPFCKLYETMNDAVKDQQVILAMLLTKIVYLEGYITAKGNHANNKGTIESSSNDTIINRTETINETLSNQPSKSINTYQVGTQTETIIDLTVDRKATDKEKIQQNIVNNNETINIKNNVSTKQQTPSVMLVLNQANANDKCETRLVTPSFGIFETTGRKNKPNKGPKTVPTCDNEEVLKATANDHSTEKESNPSLGTIAPVATPKWNMSSSTPIITGENSNSESVTNNKSKQIKNQNFKDKLDSTDPLTNLSTYSDEISDSPTTLTTVNQKAEQTQSLKQKTTANIKENRVKMLQERDYETLEQKRNRLTNYAASRENIKEHKQTHITDIHSEINKSKNIDKTTHTRNKSEELSTKKKKKMDKEPITTSQVQNKIQELQVDKKRKPKVYKETPKKRDHEVRRSNNNTKHNTSSRPKQQNETYKRASHASKIRNIETEENGESHSTKNALRYLIRLTQRSCIKEEIILNRRTVLKILRQVKDLQRLHTDNLKIVEPWHTQHGAVTILHLTSLTTFKKILNNKRDIYNSGYYVEDLTTYSKEERIESIKIRETDATVSKSSITKHEKHVTKDTEDYPQKDHKAIIEFETSKKHQRSHHEKSKNEHYKTKNDSVHNKITKKENTATQQQKHTIDSTTKITCTQRVGSTSMAQCKQSPNTSNKTGIWAWLPRALNLHRKQ